jgi:CRP-like cAMP-binding protein
MNRLEHLVLMHARGVPERWDHPMTWATALATFPLFLEVSKRQLRKLARQGTSAEFSPGETIIVAGDRSNCLYVILVGEVRAVTTRESRTLGSGDYFGEMAMIDGGSRSATVVAMTYVQVIKLPAATVVRLTRRHPAITLRMLRDLSTRLRHLETQPARAT